MSLPVWWRSRITKVAWIVTKNLSKDGDFSDEEYRDMVFRFYSSARVVSILLFSYRLHIVQYGSLPDNLCLLKIHLLSHHL